ncbi:hypothetical protein ACQKWADRAFT_311150 [Trichoderma austrokoningii]
MKYQASGYMSIMLLAASAQAATITCLGFETVSCFNCANLNTASCEAAQIALDTSENSFTLKPETDTVMEFESGCFLRAENESEEDTIQVDAEIAGNAIAAIIQECITAKDTPMCGTIDCIESSDFDVSISAT